MRFIKYTVALFCLHFIISTNCIRSREVIDNIEDVFYLTRKLSSYPKIGKKNDYYKTILSGNNVRKTTCESSPCKNGGLCVATPTGYLCQCQKGYMGTTCAISLLANDPRTRIPSKPDHVLRFLLASTAIAIGFILLIFCWCYVAVERNKLEEQRLCDIDRGLKPANSPSVNLCEACFQLVSRILPGCCADDDVTTPAENTTGLVQIMEAVAKEKQSTGRDIGQVLQSESFINKFMEEKEQHPTEENKPTPSTTDTNQQLTGSKTKLKSHPDLTTLQYQKSYTSHKALATKISKPQHHKTSDKSLTTKTSHQGAMKSTQMMRQDNTTSFKNTSAGGPGGAISAFRSTEHCGPNINHNMYITPSQDTSYIQSDPALIFNTRSSYTENEPKVNTSRVMAFDTTRGLTQNYAESSSRQVGFSVDVFSLGIVPPPSAPKYSYIKYTPRNPKVSSFNANASDDVYSD